MTQKILYKFKTGNTVTEGFGIIDGIDPVAEKRALKERIRDTFEVPLKDISLRKEPKLKPRKKTPASKPKKKAKRKRGKG